MGGYSTLYSGWLRVSGLSETAPNLIGKMNLYTEPQPRRRSSCAGWVLLGDILVVRISVKLRLEAARQEHRQVLFFETAQQVIEQLLRARGPFKGGGLIDRHDLFEFFDSAHNRLQILRTSSVLLEYVRCDLLLLDYQRSWLWHAVA